MMAEKNMVEAIHQKLKQKMEEDSSVVVLGEDVGVNGGVFRVTDGLIDQFEEERVMDTPLDEAGIIGSSMGMAINGLKPVAEIQFSGFIPQGFHHIKQHLARMRMRTQGDINVPIVIRAPYGGGIHALEHHSESQEAIYARTEGLKVVMPSNPSDAANLLEAAIEDPDPVLFLEPKKIYRSFKEEVKDEEVKIGKAKKVKEGTDITVVSWGAMARESLEAVEEAEEQGISVEMLDMRTVFPLDDEAVIESVQKTGRLVIVSEEPRLGSIAGEISATVSEEALLSLEAPIKRITAPDVPYPLYKLEKYYMPQKSEILEGINETVEF